MWCAGLPAALSMDGGEGRYARGAVYSIVCTRCGQVSGGSCSSVQNASAMPPSWLRESFAVRWCAATHSAVLPEKR